MKTMQNLQIIFSFIIIIINKGSSSISSCHLESHSCLIDVLESPQVGYRHVPTDVDITLRCSAKSAIWYYEDQVVYIGSDWLLERAKAEQSGRYACHYDQIKWANLTLKIGNSNSNNNNNESGSDLANFEVVESYLQPLNESLLPRFSQPLEAFEQRNSGGMFQLNCSPTTTFPWTNISWFHNNSQVLGNSRIRLKKWMLTVLQLQPEDAGNYRCRSCNKHGCSDSNNSHLEVITRQHSAPVIIPNYPQNVSVAMFEHVSFDCKLEVSQLAAQITWVHQRVPGDVSALLQRLLKLDKIQDDAEVDVLTLTSKDEPQILRLGHVEPVDQGWYICLAENKLGRTVGAAYLNVLDTQYPATIAVTTTTTTTTSTVSPATNSDDDNDDDNKNLTVEKSPVFKKTLHRLQHLVSGETLTLACPSIAHPPANISWTFNKDNKEYRSLERDYGGYKLKSWSLTMENVISKDSALYMCKVCNILGCIHFEFSVVVVDRFRGPPIIRIPDNKTALINSNVRLSCSAISDVGVKSVWIRDDTNATNKNNVVRKPLNTTEENGDLVLTLNNVTHSDEGWYTCTAATAALGSSNASLYLHVIDHLPTLYRRELLFIISFTVAVVMIFMLFLLGSAFIVYILRRLRRKKPLKRRIEIVHQWTKKVIIYKPASLDGSSCTGDLQIPVIKIEKQRTTFSNTTTGGSLDLAQAFNEYEFPLDSNWEIPRQQLLELGSILGEGAFGRVVMAEAYDLPRSPAPVGSTMGTIVAVKMVKEEHTDADMANLVREMEVMKMIGKHINIINFLGCCSQSGPLWVVVEYARHGNLKDFLKRNRPCTVQSRNINDGYVDAALVKQEQLSQEKLINFALQTARGMEYLASQQCIHRDLAARNVLVGDDYVIKISDFGLARNIQSTEYYRMKANGVLPMKWMAPESLKEYLFDSQSDAWSYGVLLWEIMTYGEEPYPNIMSAEELYSYLITGQRMKKPSMCTLNIYLVMRQCWNFESCARPTFTELVESFDSILQKYSSNPKDAYLDLSMPMPETASSSDDENDGSETETFRETLPLRCQYTYKFN